MQKQVLLEENAVSVWIDKTPLQGARPFLSHFTTQTLAPPPPLAVTKRHAQMGVAMQKVLLLPGTESGVFRTY